MTNRFQYTFEKNGFVYSPESIAGLTEYEKYQLSFHPERPKYLDYLSLFQDAEECLQSREFGACLIQVHRAELNGISVLLIGQQSGPTSDYKKFQNIAADPTELDKWNHGMPTPASYQKAIEGVSIANDEKRIIIVFVDTPGADPTEASEAGGIAWKIGGTIQALVETPMPTISIIINRGCSGGAIALTAVSYTHLRAHET